MPRQRRMADVAPTRQATAPRQGTAPRPATPKTPVTAPQHPAATRAEAPPIADMPRPSIWRRLQTPLIILCGVIAGFGIQTLAFGLVLLGIYAAFAFLFRVHSRTTFALALISLIAVPVILVAHQNTEVAGNFATYTFILIVIGIVALVRESPARTTSRYLHAKKRAG